jgi:tetratricopeptide (TPR) repeat protein
MAAGGYLAGTPRRGPTEQPSNAKSNDPAPLGRAEAVAQAAGQSLFRFETVAADGSTLGRQIAAPRDRGASAKPFLNAPWPTDAGSRMTVILVNNEPLNPADEMIPWTGTTDQVIQFYQARAAKDRDNPSNYSGLGAAYIQKTRETGDVTYYDLAEKALKQALKLRPDDRIVTTVTTRLALVSLSKHQFRDALVYAQKALDRGTGQLFPYAITGDAYFETGAYEKAALAYSKMAGLQGAAYPYSRLAALRFLRGDLLGAIEEMERGVEALLVGKAPRENVAWGETRLGEFFFQAGQLDDAADAYQNALQRYSAYHRALAGLARVRAVQKNYAEAITLYQKALAIIPLPEYAAELGDVYTRIGRGREARKQYDLVEYIGYLNTVNKAIYNRDLAFFYSDHDLKLKQSLELAKRELDVRRDIYTYDVLAWALYKNGNPQDAVAAMADALKLGTKDARLFFHAGMIHRALGDTEKARRYLQQALATNSHFHVLQADVARQALTDLGPE